ncbi:hypothetical protein C1646_696238 [Rhizophagus diaphanus]|nr:hypothetical protein C1646_696238 [Rhizophagus diaphanus] [Rhizophagus sp. MUCL 43196]
MEIEIDPREVLYSQDSIRPRFKDDDRHVEETIRQLVKGKISPRHIERIRVCTLNGRMHSLDNRRLYVFKEAINRGGNFETVPAVRSYAHEELQNKMSKSSPFNDWSVIRVRKDTLSGTRYNYSRYTYDTDSDDDEDTNTFANTSYTRTPQYANTQYTTYTSTQYTTSQYTTPQYTTPQYTTPQSTTPRYTTPQYTYSSTQNMEEENDSGWCVIL